MTAWTGWAIHTCGICWTSLLKNMLDRYLISCIEKLLKIFPLPISFDSNYFGETQVSLAFQHCPELNLSAFRTKGDVSLQGSAR